MAEPLFRKFVGAVWGNWQGIFGGSMSLILTILQAAAQLWNPSWMPVWAKSIPPVVWFAFGLLFVFWSCFLLWRAEVRHVERLAFPESRPKLAFLDWGPLSRSTPNIDFGDGAKDGFYIKNHGEAAALNLRIEPFELNRRLWRGEILPVVESGAPDFVPTFGLTPNKLDTEFLRAVDLKRHLREEFNPDNQVIYDELLHHSLKISIVYRDYNNLWYRTRCDLLYFPAEPGKIKFSAPVQEKLGESEPPTQI